ncbi:MAG: ATP-binding cassette domain-containing protein [Gordonia sp. (in: high G+C Gram-positive bacteria)]|uniref:ATP-binding cassette domain-containing protein n=1 Tax=Gordonia sp. (in: high G+C Gram-positive bacteria) TaxID=84139 RepID=UPI0039E6DA0E
MGVLFAFEAVSLARDATTILDELTLDVPDAGVTAVVGRSGSGKSTMLRCGNLLESPDSGRVMFRGEDLAGLDPRAHRRRVAMVFQRPTVFPGTAFDNLRAADPELGEVGAAGLLDRVGLSHELLHREADHFSGGEAQRLCLARALATSPEVVLADECTSALDGDSTRVLEDLARTLADDGIPIVWVTHDREQMARIADHMIELDQGRLLAAQEVTR